MLHRVLLFPIGCLLVHPLSTKYLYRTVWKNMKVTRCWATEISQFFSCSCIWHFCLIWSSKTDDKLNVEFLFYVTQFLLVNRFVFFINSIPDIVRYWLLNTLIRLKSAMIHYSMGIHSSEVKLKRVPYLRICINSWSQSSWVGSHWCSISTPSKEKCILKWIFHNQSRMIIC